MSLAERIDLDRDRVFLRLDHFASWHTWNGMRFKCVTDDEVALKRKNNNVVDISWQPESWETLLFVREEDWPGRRVPNEQGYFDGRPVKIMSIGENMGLLEVLLGTNSPQALSAEY